MSGHFRRVAGSWADDPPHPLSVTAPRLPVLAADLPEVRQLVESGWELVPDAPMWAFLPAVWPREHRAWVADRSTYYTTESCQTAGSSEWVTRTYPSTDTDRASVAADERELCRSCGVAGWRPHRLWLLRGPAGRRVDDIIALLIERADDRGLPLMCSADFVGFSDGVLREVFHEL